MDLLDQVVQDIEKKENMKDQFYSGKECVSYVLDEIQKNDRDKIIKYPYSMMNKAFEGIFPTTFCVVGADTGLGKSELLGHIAFSAAEQGKKVVYFDFENDDGDFIMRQIAKKTSKMMNKEISVARLRTMVESDEILVNNVMEAAEKIAETTKDMRIFKNKDIPTIEQFIEILDTIEDVDLVIVDHLHYFNFDSAKESHAVQISLIMRELRKMTKKRIPIFVASHLKQRHGNKLPTNYDLFGSSNIAKEAKNVILMSRNESGQTDFQITKNRDGKLLGHFTATYNKVLCELQFNETF